MKQLGTLQRRCLILKDPGNDNVPGAQTTNGFLHRDHHVSVLDCRQSLTLQSLGDFTASTSPSSPHQFSRHLHALGTPAVILRHTQCQRCIDHISIGSQWSRQFLDDKLSCYNHNNNNQRALEHWIQRITFAVQINTACSRTVAVLHICIWGGSRGGAGCARGGPGGTKSFHIYRCKLSTKVHIFIWGGLRGGTRLFWGGFSHPMPPW